MNYWRDVTCGTVSEVTEPDISVAFQMKHLAAVVTADDRQVTVSHCHSVSDFWQVRTADRYNRTHLHVYYTL